MNHSLSFPPSFVWGAATASYQLEGSTQGVDGCAESVWDMHCRRSGAIKDGSNGFVACDHYHRYREDVALMNELGLNAYRFSIMWPRVMPEGTGAVNEKGMDFYDRLVDELLAAGITPWVTLFHWDFPLALFQRGGWLNADSPQWFEDYTREVVKRLSDRVHHWLTLNEPACFIEFGHRTGMQAPGLQLADKEACRVWHHAMLAHGRAVRAIREESLYPAPQVGYAPVFRTTIPDTEDPADIEAARTSMFAHQAGNLFDTRWNLDPCFRGAYPEIMMQYWDDAAPRIQDGDMVLIRQELDFLGLNIYQSERIRAGADGAPEVVPYPADYPRNQLGWPITPEALRWATLFLFEEYGKPLIITENGITLDDKPNADGEVNDVQRIAFLNDYLSGLQRSVDDGIPVLGYFHWSLCDNFEWAEGYVPRFGLIHVDYASQRRTIKASGRFYRDIIRGQIAAPCIAQSSQPETT